MPTVTVTSDRQTRPRDDGDPGRRRRDIALLSAGACLGVVLAIYGLLVGDGPRALPPDAAARINGRTIDNSDLADALAALGSDSRDRLDRSDRRWILGRLIEEELLVQRALELDLGHADRAVRAALVDAMIRRVTRDAAAATPTTEALEAWYADNAALFTGYDRLRVEAWTAPDPAAADRAREALAAGAPDALPDTVSPLPGLPRALMPPTKLRDYVGPTATTALIDAPEGAWVGPIPYAGRHLIARVAERRAGAVPAIEEIRTRVEAAWRRERMDAALSAYLEELRSRADIETAAP
ncbi:MAG: peptidylprolyl isomerase [Gammaproteobacteria bacterium]|jgi:peptidyl-prolyl cis-trans isomerase C